jgi:hypothetical protein
MAGAERILNRARTAMFLLQQTMLNLYRGIMFFLRGEFQRYFFRRDEKEKNADKDVHSQGRNVARAFSFYILFGEESWVCK